MPLAVHVVKLISAQQRKQTHQRKQCKLIIAAALQNKLNESFMKKRAERRCDLIEFFIMIALQYFPGYRVQLWHSRFYFKSFFFYFKRRTRGRVRREGRLAFR